MRHERWTSLVVRVALFYFSLAVICQDVHAQAETPFRLLNAGVPMISIQVNDQGPFNFLIDTGTDTTIVGLTLARQLSLAAVDHVRLNTLAGSEDSVESVVRRLTIGLVRADDLRVLVEDLSSVRKIFPGVDGVLGENFLSRFNYTLDYRAHSIRFELNNEVRDTLYGEKVPILQTGGRLIVLAEAEADGHAKLRLTLDSGANSLLLLNRACEALGLSTSATTIRRIGWGASKFAVGRVRTLAIGSQRFYDVQAFLPTEPAVWERLEDGVLPAKFFDALYVNNHEGFVVLNPRVLASPTAPER